MSARSAPPQTRWRRAIIRTHARDRFTGAPRRRSARRRARERGFTKNTIAIARERASIRSRRSELDAEPFGRRVQSAPCTNRAKYIRRWSRRPRRVANSRVVYSLWFGWSQWPLGEPVIVKFSTAPAVVSQSHDARPQLGSVPVIACAWDNERLLPRDSHFEVRSCHRRPTSQLGRIGSPTRSASTLSSQTWDSRHRRIPSVVRRHVREWRLASVNAHGAEKSRHSPATNCTASRDGFAWRSVPSPGFRT